ncbi:MAG TPA: hypothetical protein VFS44_14870 [Gemmatimonadaceae bacterium]|nr:hypothetical protein [Gemmatimonadaceae bacterium]
MPNRAGSPRAFALDDDTPADRRRYLALRAVTVELLGKVRYLNQVAIAMRTGMLDLEGAAQEIDLTERQLHELVRRMRDAAGLDDAGA